MKNKQYFKKIFLKVFSYLPSEFKIFIYRRLGADIGKNVELGIGSYIVPFDGDFKKIHIADNVSIEDNVAILAKHIFLKDSVKIKDNTRIWGQSDLQMGTDAYIDQHCLIDLRSDITIADNAGIGADSWIYTHGVWHSIFSGAPVKFGPVIIKDRAWIAANVFIMPDITIGEDAIIGARSVVTKDVKPDSVVAGNPAKEIGKTTAITKKLSREEKTGILRQIITDFVRVYDTKASNYQKTGDRVSFQYQSTHFILAPEDCTSSDVNLLQKEFGPDLALVFFTIPEQLVTCCADGGIPWIDLDSGKKSAITQSEVERFEAFLGNYGVVLKIQE
jgi:acetyltransferase-like isoleucine patch superfamily enzyme